MNKPVTSDAAKRITSHHHHSPSTKPDLAAINAALSNVQDPETGRSAQQLGQIRDVRLDGNRLSLTLALTTWAAPLWQETRSELEQLLGTRFPDLTELKINLA